MTSTGDTPVFSTKYPLLYQPVRKKNSATAAETTNIAVWQKKVDPDTTPRTAKVVGYFDMSAPPNPQKEFSQSLKWADFNLDNTQQHRLAIKVKVTLKESQQTLTLKYDGNAQQYKIPRATHAEGMHKDQEIQLEFKWNETNGKYSIKLQPTSEGKKANRDEQVEQQLLVSNVAFKTAFLNLNPTPQNMAVETNNINHMGGYAAVNGATETTAEDADGSPPNRSDNAADPIHHQQHSTQKPPIGNIVRVNPDEKSVDSLSYSEDEKSVDSLTYSESASSSDDLSTLGSEEADETRHPAKGKEAVITVSGTDSSAALATPRTTPNANQKPKPSADEAAKQLREDILNRFKDRATSKAVHKLLPSRRNFHYSIFTLRLNIRMISPVIAEQWSEIIKNFVDLFLQALVQVEKNDLDTSKEQLYLVLSNAISKTNDCLALANTAAKQQLDSALLESTTQQLDELHKELVEQYEALLQAYKTYAREKAMWTTD